jgi:hypothetical protein
LRQGGAFTWLRSTFQITLIMELLIAIQEVNVQEDGYFSSKGQV